MDSVISRACLSFWFPKLLGTGVPVPETRIVTTDLNLDGLLEGEAVPGFGAFVDELRRAAGELGGFPCFLRTGQGSGKHQWEETCFVPSAAAMGSHVANLVEWSAMVDIIGLPTRVWAVRRLLPLRSTFTAFHGFPVNRERRYFIEGGRVLCHHSYWPVEALQQGRPSVPGWLDLLTDLNAETPAEVATLTGRAEWVSANFDGAWSLDFAQDTTGQWWAIDMAPAERSYHWPNCPKAVGAPTSTG